MLTENQLRAIELISLGELANEEIARQCSTSPRTLYRWKLNDEFRKSWHKRTMEIKISLEAEGSYFFFKFSNFMIFFSIKHNYPHLPFSN